MIARFAIVLLCVAACADEYRDAALKRAEESVKAATEKASKDPSRPVYHFRPPANWMNDPNGTIFHNGYYHLFYQHNPYGDAWGHMHWGHARSKDLVHWEHLPIALWPSEDKGEAHVFSGCAAVNGDGVPMLFYTSVASAEKKRPNEQWAAIGDPDLIKWEKHPKNPILDVKSIPFEIGSDWRDPFIFKAEGRTFLVCGADTKDEAIIPIFEAETPQLDKWTYRGILYRQPKSAVEFFECPNFFPLDGKWVLIYSPYKPLQYAVGSFDLKTFKFLPEKESVLDHGTFYASNIYAGTSIHIKDKNDIASSGATTPPPSRPTILVGWIRGFREGLGWNGCMSIPRRLEIGADGFLRQIPTEDLRKLDYTADASVSWKGNSDFAETRLSPRSMYKVIMSAPKNGSLSVKMQPRNNSAPPIALSIDNKGVLLDGVAAMWNQKRELKQVVLNWYIDNCLFELFVSPYSAEGASESGTIGMTKVIEYSPEGYDLRVDALGDADIIQTGGVDMQTIWAK